MSKEGVKAAIWTLYKDGWFREPGAYCLVDGQFGSTGKGVAASLLQRVAVAAEAYLIAMTNAGPNSGHTAVFKGNKFVTRQMPIAAVQAAMSPHGEPCIAYLNAGAIIDLAVLRDEIEQYRMRGRVFVHPNAAVIWNEHKAREANGSVAAIASTAKGVGAALADKVMRKGNTFGKLLGESSPEIVSTFEMGDGKYVLLETAQGFSLGINQRFYPYCTSRECTVMQALADACIHPAWLRKTMMTVRTFPIRVGNTERGKSGGCYEDQYELTWEALGVEPELTTVTKRVRRVFTWSRTQFREALMANRPDAIFVNFMNYLPEGAAVEIFLAELRDDYYNLFGKAPRIITGWGPNTEDVKHYE